MEKTWEELPKTFTPAVRKRVLNDWHQFFPHLCIRKMSFSYLLGPLEVGFGFDMRATNSTYRPEFSTHLLCKESTDLFANLAVESRKSITLRWHDKNYREAVHRFKEEIPIPLDRASSLEHVINTYKRFVESQCEWELDSQLEDPPLLASWGGNQKLAQECLNWSYDIMLNLWKRDSKKAALWRTSMEEKIKDPEKLRQIAREQVVFHKLEKVPSCCFTDTPYQECLTKVPFPKP